MNKPNEKLIMTNVQNTLKELHVKALKLYDKEEADIYMKGIIKGMEALGELLQIEGRKVKISSQS